jgi:antitoxin VapB
MRKAKVFMSGNSQAVRLPRDFQFNSNEVSIEKKGGKIILWEIPQNLSNAFNLLTKLPDDFFSKGRQDLPPQERENF